MDVERAIIVINKTRLEQLIARFNTKAQSKFYIEHAGGDFEDYEAEHDSFQKSLAAVRNIVARHLKYKILDRQYLANYIFSPAEVVVVVGQDGLVANTAKYVNALPIIAVNPDSSRYDGVLLPFAAANFEAGLLRTVAGTAVTRTITMAEVRLNDGQRLLGFNDLYIGNASHISSRYKITFDNLSENHSSSGIIVSTGAGSTGWLSSLLNMANGICRSFNQGLSDKANLQFRMNWDERKLVFVVREPFLSKSSRIDLTCGIIPENKKLVLESFMPVRGVIFSDGIEADFLHFNSGAIARIGVAEEKAVIVQK